MANLQIKEEGLWPGIAGILSGGGDLWERNSQAVAASKGTTPNTFNNHSSAIVDYGVTVVSVANLVGDFGLPREGASQLAATGIGIGARKLTTQLGDMILGLTTTSTKGASRLDRGHETTTTGRGRETARNGRHPAGVPAASVAVGALDEEPTLFTVL